MTMLSVDANDPTPPFEQIRRQLAFLIDSGELETGQRLPTVRQLAADLRVAPGTVSRSFKELEAAGYVETRRAAGTRVLARQRIGGEGEVDAESATVQVLAERYVDAAARLGATPQQAVDAVRAATSRRAGAVQE